ncbi:MAG: ABC transporter ATP-binding protein [Syntrophobacteraceae bacterium]|nr:ABC transporter ATP-binding protein [Desulfobacteraceae bacterium]
MQIDLSVNHVVKEFGDFTAVNDVSFEVETGKFFSILGPSGCGKTTVLRMIAGMWEPTRGTIQIRGRDMAGVEPNKRPVNMVYQHLALFPMMNVEENIAFGLRRRGEKGPELMRKVEASLESVGLPGYGRKKIHQLSGGQKQRVAIARCLILRPVVLLLDEPLGSLDLKLREHMKVELKKLQAQVGTTFVYITHDQSEAMVMSDYVAVMRAGVFEQIDRPRNIYREPATPFVAQFVGDNNQFVGTLRKDERGCFFVQTPEGGSYRVDTRPGGEPGCRVEMYVRPEAMIIEPDKSLPDLNRVNVEVKSILFDGANSRLLVTPEGSEREMIVALPQNRQYDHIRAKDCIRIGWRPSSAVCFKESGTKAYDEL